MSDPTGKLIKTTNAVYTFGVVGQRCTRYEDPPAAQTNADKGSDPPRTPSPPWTSSNSSGGSSSSGCGGRTLITWEETGKDGKKVKYGAYVPTGLVGAGGGVLLPSGCPGVSEPFRI